MTLDPVRVAVHERFAAILDGIGDAIVAVDMPIGLMRHGWRDADAAVKAFLGGKASSLFAIPPRAVIEQTTHAEACAVSERLAGQRVSLQAFYLFPKIRELDEHVRDSRIFEVHPETSFAVMAGDPLASSKHDTSGARQRRRLLRDAGITVRRPRVSGVGVDDVLDAAACAWTARRIASGEARRFPEGASQRDGRRRIEIVA